MFRRQGADNTPAHRHPAHKGQQVLAWLALSLTVGVVVTLYLSLSLSISAHPLLMPLDDTYIHFQYARQLAAGDPFVYSAGDPPTSGGTSLLYPVLLSIGYRLGFDGWDLSYWAVTLGAVSFAGAVWLVYRIAAENPLAPGLPETNRYALVMALSFAVSGPFVWAALSGMETAWFLLVALLTFYAVQRDRMGLAIVAATLTTLTRPEGVALSGLAMLALALRVSWPAGTQARVKRAAGLVLPVLAAAVQPLANWLSTGEISSSGLQAKSLLTNAGAAPAERLEMVLEFFGRMWQELLSGYSADYGTYVSPLLADIALAGVLVGVWLAWRRRVNMALLALGWMVVLTAGISTLDTAFWQFKRYQLPVMALFFPAAAWTSALLGAQIKRRTPIPWARWILPALILVPALFTTVTFARAYRNNVRVVRDQQVAMVTWIREHLPPEARLGVHDVGLIGYLTGRPLYDVVGLTTPGAAESWRLGPGAIYETMADSEYRPDYFAIYPDVQGLRYLLDAGVFGEVLREFPVELPDDNVASATDYQAVYRADWSGTQAEEQVAQSTTLDYTAGMRLVDQVDVANLSSEAAHDYQWSYGEPVPGFVSEVYRLPYHACGLESDDCWATDGVRVLHAAETFTLKVNPGQDVLLVTRVHGRASVPLSLTVNDRWQQSRVQPAVSGRWLEVVTWIPAAEVVGRDLQVEIDPQIADPFVDAYRPAYHWAFQGEFEPSTPDAAPIATVGPDDSIRLLQADIEFLPADPLTVDLVWSGTADWPGDGVMFVHVYDDVNREPIAQTVQRPGGGVLPPQNWLPGILIRDRVTIDLPDDLLPGAYPVAVGFFDAITGQRYPAAGTGSDPDGRVFIGEIVIKESARES